MPLIVVPGAVSALFAQLIAVANSPSQQQTPRNTPPGPFQFGSRSPEPPRKSEPILTPTAGEAPAPLGFTDAGCLSQADTHLGYFKGGALARNSSSRDLPNAH